MCHMVPEILFWQEMAYFNMIWRGLGCLTIYLLHYGHMDASPVAHERDGARSISTYAVLGFAFAVP